MKMVKMTPLRGPKLDLKLGIVTISHGISLILMVISERLLPAQAGNKLRSAISKKIKYIDLCGNLNMVNIILNLLVIRDF